MANPTGSAPDLTAELAKLTQIVPQMASLQEKTVEFSFEEFKVDGEPISSYFDRFRLQLQLKRIPEKYWAAHLRVYMGNDLASALRECIFPEAPEKMSFDKIIDQLVAHFTAARNKYSEAIKFRQIIQEPDETVTKFARRLKKGALYCEFGNFIDYSLIIQFIHGLQDDHIRNDVVNNKPNLFKDALKLAIDLEATKLASSELKFKTGDNQVHKFAHASRPREYRPAHSHSSPRPGNYTRSPARQGEPSPTGRRFSSARRSLSPRLRRASPGRPPSNCNGCGGQHWRIDCPHYDSKCLKCSLKGHIASHCRKSIFSKNSKNPRYRSNSTHHTTDSRDNSDDDGYPYSSVTFFDDRDSLHSVAETMVIAKRPPPAIVTVKINNAPLQMELDTGGVASMVNVNVLKRTLPTFKLQPSTRTFVSYTKHAFSCMGYTTLDVTFRGRTVPLNLYVVPFPTDSIFGREWITEFADLLSFEEFFKVSESPAVVSTQPRSILKNNSLPQPPSCTNPILQKYSALFADTAGKLVGPPAEVTFREDSRPVFARARQIPFALREQYAAEIDKKIASGFYVQVSSSQWASPTHVVMKGSKIRITGDYKSTLNPQLVVDEYPIPRVEELFHRLRGAKFFSRLDITDAYMSLPCSSDFCAAMTLNTPTHGLIQPNRAQYGVASIPAIWQRRMEEVLRGLSCAINFFDDILVFSKSQEGMLEALDSTFSKLQQSGLKLQKSKCAFMLQSIEFLGHTVDSTGLRCQKKHIQAILESAVPQNASQLRTFIGKVTYYHAFIPNLSTATAPLRKLLNSEKFQWNDQARQAYEFLKSELTSDRVLVAYDPQLPLVLATDASPVGLGCVLSHIMANGSERPISFASKALNSTEQRYPQIDREALAIVWGVKRFFQYLYARKFIIVTDNKPISHIFSPKASLPQFTLSRCANYAAYLANFTYDIKFKPSTQNANADFLSRFPVKQNPIPTSKIPEGDDFDQFVQLQIQQIPITSTDIAKETLKDKQLSTIITALQNGNDLRLIGYKGREAEYRMSDGCLMLGQRVVIPPKFRQILLEELHMAHIGIVKMKGLARSLIYWPSIDEDIERMAKACEPCMKNAKMPPKIRSHHWEYPKTCWDRIHVDYAEFLGKYILIAVDAYSKWMNVAVTTSTTAKATCDILEGMFSLYGVPTVVVSDNGPQFSSSVFKEFLQIQGVRFHKTSAVHHPSTNGQAERGVQTLKRALKNAGATPSNLQHHINAFLLQYHKSPHQTTGQPPSILFLGRVIRSRLDLVKPDLHRRISEQRSSSSARNFRSFDPGDRVMYRSFAGNVESWKPGVITSKFGDLHYEVRSDDGLLFRRHIDQLLRGSPKKSVALAADPVASPAHIPISTPRISAGAPTRQAHSQTSSPRASLTHPRANLSQQTPASPPPQVQAEAPPAPARRYSLRARKPITYKE